MKRAAMVAFALALPVLLFLLGGAMLPAGFEMQARGAVQAPQAEVFELVTTHEGLAEWTLWAAEGVQDLSAGALPGPDHGVGMAWEWDLGGEPYGTMTLVEMEVPTRVVYEVEFGGRTLTRTLTLTADGATDTQVVWNEMIFAQSVMERWSSLIMNDSVEASIRDAIKAIDGAAKERRRSPAPSTSDPSPRTP